MTEKMTPDESAVAETDVAAKIAKFVTTSSWHSLEELQRAISAIINATGRNAPMTPSNDGKEAERVRDALESPRLPWWLEYGAVALGVAAMLILARGGGI